MTCPNCGEKVGNSVVLCPHCNKIIDKNVKPVRASQPQPVRIASSYTAPPAAAYTKPKPKAAPKKSVLLLISAILGVLYAIYSIFYWAGAASGTSGAAEAIGAGIATALVMPHLICAILAAVFNTLGWAMNSRAFALTSAILYAVAMVMFPMYFMFVIIQMILSFVGFAQLKKLNEN